MTPSSLALSFSSRFLGVAAPPAFATLFNWVAAALGCGGALFRSLLGCFKGRLVADEAASFAGTGVRPFCSSEGRETLVGLDLESGWFWTGDSEGRC